MSSWKSQVAVAPSITDRAPMVAITETQTIIRDLRAAGALFDARNDAFAAGKGATCRDIADKLARFGSFASDAQRGYAAKLIEWSKPRGAKPVDAGALAVADQLVDAAKAYEARGDVKRADTCRDIAAKLIRFGSFASEAQQTYALQLASVAAPAMQTLAAKKSNELALPKLFDVMQRHAKLHMDHLTISRKNQDTLCWLSWDNQLVGKLHGGVAVVWPGKAGNAFNAVMALLAEIEADPLATAQKYGKLAGRCCSCGRDLTDPASIEAGIGPICAEKF